MTQLLGASRLFLSEILLKRCHQMSTIMFYIDQFSMIPLLGGEEKNAADIMEA